MTEVEKLNPHWRWNWRKKKKHVRNRSNAIEGYGYFEDCSFHPCRLTVIYPYRTSSPHTFYDSYVEGESLVEPDHVGNCSMFHCAPVPLKEKDALERAAFWKQNGEMKYMLKYVYGECDQDQKQKFIDYYNSKEKHT